MGITTGRGDSGETDLLFNRRVAKTSLRVAALGDVDELDAALGLARAASRDEDLIALIDRVQGLLVGLMGQLAVLPEDEPLYQKKGYASLSEADLEWITAETKEREARGIKFKGWARPGMEGSLERAGLDFARSITRRAERGVLALHESGEPVPVLVRLFFNRLSDFLWVLAHGAED